MRRTATEGRINKRTEKVVANARHFLDVSEDSGLWSGPSVYFHRRTLDLRDKYALPSGALDDPLFVEYLYATLSAWGLHRMGSPSGRLLDFPEFQKRLQACSSEVDSLDHLTIETVDPQVITDNLWPLVERLGLRPGERPSIVVASKTLHHLLPRLVPPIDRQYTLAFFQWKHRAASTSQKIVFADVFPRLVHLANAIKPSVKNYESKVFRSYLPKIVDNAIVGFMLEESGRTNSL